MPALDQPWILVLCHEFPPLGGGGGKTLFLLSRELHRRGVKLEVWTADPGKHQRWAHDFPVAYIPVGRRARFETHLGRMGLYAAKAVAMAWSRRGPRPALVLSHLGIPAGLAGALVSRRLRAPHAIWYQGSDVHGGRLRGCGRLQRFLLRRIGRGAAVNFFVSAGLRDLALSYGALPN